MNLPTFPARGAVRSPCGVLLYARREARPVRHETIGHLVRTGPGDPAWDDRHGRPASDARVAAAPVIRETMIEPGASGRAEREWDRIIWPDCPDCGGELRIDPEVDALVCVHTDHDGLTYRSSFCRASFLVEVPA